MALSDSFDGIVDGGKRYVRTEDLFDPFFGKLIRDLKALPASEQDAFLHETEKKGLIEMVGNCCILHRYKEFHIQSMLKCFGESVIKDYEIVNSLGLTTFPQLIEYIAPPETNSMIIITRVSGNTGKNSNECNRYDPDSVSNITKRVVIDDLKKLESLGYVLASPFRHSVCVNKDGRIVILDFKLVSIEMAKERHYLGEAYHLYNVLFGEYTPSFEYH